MSLSGRPPALLAKTAFVTFVTATLLLGVIFVVVTMSVRTQVRQAARANLESGQRAFAAVQSREQRSLHMQARTAAESPTLKAAVDTYAAEAASGTSDVRQQLLNTIRSELSKVAANIEADAVILVDTKGSALASAGRSAAEYPAGEPISIVRGPGDLDAPDGVVHLRDTLFKVVSVPLSVNDGTVIGAVCLATKLDHRFAEQLGEFARTDTAILSDNALIASTLGGEARQDLEAAAPTWRTAEGAIDLNGESYVFRRLFAIGDTSFYAMTSLDQAATAALQDTTRALTFIAIGALGLAFLASVWIARQLSGPVTRLSASMNAMASSRRFDTRLAPAGSSLELDTLTETFNSLMASITTAEQETQTAYTAAIRGLAATLDARDPNTAGHSERVSVLAVAIGRVLSLGAEELDVLRLGALLHDIGKIGISDEILRKPGPLTEAEYDAIKTHTVVGARIIRTVPFLARHVEIVELHHERQDGRGYPHGLRGDEIPLVARIVHVADAYDAITNARAYRAGWPPAEAMRELWRCAGTDFDAEVVGALASALPMLTAQSDDVMFEVSVA